MGRSPLLCRLLYPNLPSLRTSNDRSIHYPALLTLFPDESSTTATCTLGRHWCFVAIWSLTCLPVQWVVCALCRSYLFSLSLLPFILFLHPGSMLCVKFLGDVGRQVYHIVSWRVALPAHDVFDGIAFLYMTH